MNARTINSLSLTHDGTFNVNDKIKDLHMYNDLDYMIRKYIEDDDQISCFFLRVIRAYFFIISRTFNIPPPRRS